MCANDKNNNLALSALSFDLHAVISAKCHQDVYAACNANTTGNKSVFIALRRRELSGKCCERAWRL